MDLLMIKKNLTEIAGDVAYELFVPGYVKTIRSAFADSQEDIKTAESEGMAALELEASKQKVIMEFQAHQARVSQEIAIAERVATSNEVEITEYYDVSGKGHAGVNVKENGISAGVGADGRKVTHRVIKFSGFGKLEAPAENG